MASWNGCTLYLDLYSFQVGNERSGGTAREQTTGPALAGNVVVNGSEIDFISDSCTGSDFGFERFTYTLSGDQLVLLRKSGPGQTNCVWDNAPGPYVWPWLAETYTRVAS